MFHIWAIEWIAIPYPEKDTVFGKPTIPDSVDFDGTGVTPPPPSKKEGGAHPGPTSGRIHH